MNIKRGALALLMAGLVFVPLSAEKAGCDAGGGGGSHQTSSVENQDEYKEWCKQVKEGDNSTYVYYYTDHKGHSGYKKGRRNIQRYVDDPTYSTKRVC